MQRTLGLSLRFKTFKLVFRLFPVGTVESQYFDCDVLNFLSVCAVKICGKTNICLLLVLELVI